MERLDKEIEQIDTQNKDKKGISFYSGHEHKYIFIETTSFQKIRFKCLVGLNNKNIPDIL
jgi:hypothetical protein